MSDDWFRNMEDPLPSKDRKEIEKRRSLYRLRMDSERND